MAPQQAFCGDDWVMAFHDSRHTGQSSEVVVPPLTLAWTWKDTNSYDNDPKFNVMQHYWMPIYYKGKLCVQGGRNANRAFCINPANGATLWQQDNPGYANNGNTLFQFDNYPAAVNGRIVTASTDFTASMDASTGGDVQASYNTNGGWPNGGVASWNNMAYTQFVRTDDNTEAFYVLQDPAKLMMAGGWYAADWRNTIIDYTMRIPAVDAGVIYENMMGVLWARDAHTSRVLWTWGKSNTGSNPAVAKGIVYFWAASQNKMVALDAAHATYNSSTGTQVPTLWSVPMWQAYSPIVSDGTLYVGSFDGYFYALDAATGATKWQFHAGDWSFTTFQMPAISGDVIYVPSSNRILYALDKRTGIEKWRYTTDRPLGPVAVGNGMVFVSDSYFNLFAFRPQTASIGPAVTALSTARVANGQAVTINLTGSGFFAGGANSQVQSIRLDDAAGTQLTGYTVAGDQSITGVTIPAGKAPGIYHLRVQTSVGLSVNEPPIEIVAANSFLPSTIGQTTGPYQPGTFAQLQRHLVRDSKGTLIAVFTGFAGPDGQDPTYNVSHDGGLTWSGQTQLHATPWNNYVQCWAATSSIWIDAQDHINSSYVRGGAQSFEKFVLSATDIMTADPGFPLYPTSGTGANIGTLAGQSSGRRWLAYEVGGQITPLYSDDGGQTWTRQAPVNVATANSPSVVIYQDKPAIFFNEGNSLAWSLWNGTQWSARQILPGPITGAQTFSSVATTDGRLHLAYVTSPGGLSYVQYSGSAWSAPQTLDSAGNSPSLTTDGKSIWCFYANASGDLVYRRTNNGQWNPPVAITSDGNYNTSPSTLVLSPDATIPVVWTAGPTNSQIVKSAVVPGDTAPVTVPVSPSAVDVSSKVKVTSSGFVVNRATRVFTATMMVTNTSLATINGPVQTLMTNLPSGVTMVNATGARNGSPFITVTTGPLAPGATSSVQVQFTNPNNGLINFIPVTYSGGV